MCLYCSEPSIGEKLNLFVFVYSHYVRLCIASTRSDFFGGSFGHSLCLPIFHSAIERTGIKLSDYFKDEVDPILRINKYIQFSFFCAIRDW